MEGPGLPKIERVQFHSGPGCSKLQVAPAQNNQKEKAGGFGYGEAKTDVRAASLPGEDIERIEVGLISLSISRSVNPGSAIANSPGVRSVGCASVELFYGVAN